MAHHKGLQARRWGWEPGKVEATGAHRGWVAGVGWPLAAALGLGLGMGAAAQTPPLAQAGTAAASSGLGLPWILGGLLGLAGAGALLALWNLVLRRRVAERTAELQQALADGLAAQQQAQQAKDALAATLHAIPDLLFTLDPQGRFLDVYASDPSKLLVPREQIIGRHVRDTLPPEAADTAQATLAAALAHGSDYGRTMCLPVDDPPRWFELSTTCQRGADGRVQRLLVLSRDITARRQAEAELLRLKDAALHSERERFVSALFDVAPVAMVHVRDGRVSSVNRHYVRLFGAPGDGPASFQHWWQQAYPDPQDRKAARRRWTRAVQAAAAGDGVIAAEAYHLVTRDGQRRDMLIGGCLVDAGRLTTFTDITEIQAAQDQLQRAKDASDAASHAKSLFLANVSHEIRSPLNAMLGYAHLLKRACAQPEQATQIDRILDAGAHLLAVVTDILDISKIEAGQLQLSPRAFDPEPLLRSVHAMLQDEAARRALSFELSLPAGLPWLVGDPVRLRQCLLNLATNALKFTERGRIGLRVALLPQADGAALLRIEVEDTGTGIAPELAAHLFERFVQADASATRRHGGTGLGLAITRELARLMGGETGVHSVPGQGSCFWFTARVHPVAPPPSDAPRAERADPPLPALQPGARVLLAEDDPTNREIATELLRQQGLVVLQARDGREAVELLRTEPVDLVLMDMQMPRLDGLQATAEIRRLPLGRLLPIVAMTANAFDEDRQACLNAGMDDFITKPVSPELLAHTLAHWLSVGSTRTMRPGAGPMPDQPFG